jgi:hypothetical protein
VVLSTDPALPVGKSVEVGDTLDLAARSVLVLRQT